MKTDAVILKDFLIKYKLFFALGFFVLFFLITILTVLFSDKNDEISQISIEPSTTTEPTRTDLQYTIPDLENEDELEEPLENRFGFQKVESLPNGARRYIFSSHISERPNLMILKGDHDFIFQRNITRRDHPIKITDYTDVDGQPKWIFKGSNFYGPDAQTYVYPDLGYAFIAKPSNGEVLEQHLFDPMKVEDYVKNYGEDIAAYP